MYVIRLARCAALGVSLVAAACTATPTAPSAAVAGPVIGVVPQGTPAIPPRISTTPARAVGATRFLAFGDSITWGALSAWDSRFLFAGAGGGYPERLQAALDAYHAPQRFTVLNEGVPGELATLALPRFRSVLLSRRPQAVLLLEGINDLANDISIARAVGGLRQMLDAASALSTPVLIATMFQTYEVTDPDGHFRPNGASAIPEFNAELRRMASGRTNVFLVDLYPVLSSRSMVGNDGIHLTEAGFEAMASAFLEAIERAFPVRGSFQ